MHDLLFGRLEAGWADWALPMTPKLFSLRNMILLVSMLFVLTGNPFALSAPYHDSAIPFFPNLFSRLSPEQPLGSSMGMLGGSPAFADFDGDQKQDVAIARLSKDQYRIVVLLSTRSQVAILDPSTQLSGFRVHACDINNDSLPDIVVTDATAMHPFVVWLGDGHGNFEIADQKLFKNGFAFSESSTYQNNRLSPDQDALDESPDPLCDKMVPVFKDPGLEQNGFVTRWWTYPHALRNAYITIAPRSPPPNNSI
jgi:hypothetical protein